MMESGTSGESAMLRGVIPALYARARRGAGARPPGGAGPTTLVGEVLLVYARRRGELAGWPARKVAAWLFTGLRLTRQNHLRRRALPLQPVELDRLPSPASSGRWESLEAMERLARVLPQLTDRERDVLRWRFDEGLSHREVGARLGVEESHARVIQNRAVRRLRELMEDPGA